MSWRTGTGWLLPASLCSARRVAVPADEALAFQAVKRSGDRGDAPTRYQQLRKGRAEAVEKQARRNSNHKIPGRIRVDRPGDRRDLPGERSGYGPARSIAMGRARWRQPVRSPP
jgi:hypothetical protein